MPDSALGEETAALRLQVAQYERWFGILDQQIRTLERERQKLSAVVNHSDAGFLVFDTSLRVVWANDTASRMLAGGHAATLDGKDCASLLCGEESACADCPAARPFRSGAVEHHEICLTGNDNKRHIYVTAMPIRAPASGIDEVIVMLQDITDLEVLRRSRTALAESEHRFRSIFEKTAAGMATLEADGRLEQANPALCRFLGRDRPTLGTATMADVLHPDDREETLSLLRRIAASDLARFEVEARYLRPDGAVVWGLTSAAALGGGADSSTHLIALVQDISERKAAERALAESEEMLRHSQKIEAIGQLAGGIAHDFNNLLTIISGYSDNLHARFERDDPAAGDVEEIFKAAERAASLTQRLLAFSRRQVLSPRVLDLNTVVVNLGKMLQRLIGNHILLETACAPALGHVHADPGQIEQVIVNLAVNARDAMPKGGILRIETGNVALDGTAAGKRGGAQPGSYVRLAVTDTGCGMDAGVRERAFEPYFTTKELGKGTGLGLATVHGIVHQSGGHVRIASEPGRGTTFEVCLPRVDSATVAAPAVADTEAEPKVVREVGRGNECVLLVEDEEGIRALVANSLRGRGYTVLEARDGAQALARLGEHRGPLPLLITDLGLPGMTGREVARRVLAMRPGVKVIYISGHAEAVLEHDPPEPGAVLIAKPFSPRALARAARELLDSH